MSNAFIQLAWQGRNEWWRYLAGFLLTVFVFLLGSTIVGFLFVLYIETDNNPATALLNLSELSPGQNPISGVSSTVIFAVNNLGFLFFFAGIVLTIRGLHARSLRSLITPARQINWLRIFQGFSIFFLICAVEIAISYGLAPQSFTLAFDLTSFLGFLPVIFLLTPIQTTAEELLFRGYLLQGIGSRMGRPASIVLSSILFMLLHANNPEVFTQASSSAKVGAFLYFFIVGAFLCWITLKDRTLELALGAHAANNMATFLLITSPNSALPTPAVFSTDEIEISLALPFYAALSMLIFSFIVFKLLRRPSITD